MIRRRLLMIALAIGTVAGFSSGFHSLRACRARQRAFEAHVAKVCVDAAKNADKNADTTDDAASYDW